MNDILKYLVVALCIGAMAANIALAPSSNDSGGGVPFVDNLIGGPEEAEETETPEGQEPVELTPEELRSLDFIVPGPRMNDSVTYGLTMFMQTYELDKETGDWERMTVSVSGTWVFNYKGMETADDGFGELHACIPVRNSLNAQFTITIERTTDGEEELPLEVSGEMRVSWLEYRDLATGRAIKSVTDGSLNIPLTSEMKQALKNVKIVDNSATEVSYDGQLTSYLDPHLEYVPSIDEQIWQKGQRLIMGSSGDIEDSQDDDPYSWSTASSYTWDAEDVEVVKVESAYSDDAEPLSKEYAAIRVNTTSKMWEFMDFYKVEWLNDTVPAPIMMASRMNSSWDENESSGYIELRNGRTMIYNGYRSGDTPIEWGDDGDIYAVAHTKTSEFSSWDEYQPKSSDPASFQLDPNEASGFALANSANLTAFIADNGGQSNFMLTGVGYNETFGPDKAFNLGVGEVICRWNMTFAAYMSPQELYQFFTENDAKRESGQPYEKYPNMTYTICIMKKGTYTDRTGYRLGEMQIENEMGKYYGYSDSLIAQYGSKSLTYAGAEEIMSQYSQLNGEIFQDGKIDFTADKVTFFLAQAEVSSDNSPVMMLAQTLTGISMPTAHYSYGIQKGQVFAGGDTLSAAVDVETGRMVFIIDISGTDLGALLGSM